MAKYLIHYKNYPDGHEKIKVILNAATRKEAIAAFRSNRNFAKSSILRIEEQIQQDWYEKVTNKFIELMDHGLIPWRRPWTGVPEDAPISYATGEPYSLLNQILLEEPGEYITFNKAKELGGNIKKGAKGKFIVFFKTRVIKETDPKTGEEKESIVPYLKHDYVFHLKDTEGIPSRLKERPPLPEKKPDEAAESIIEGYLSREDHPSFQNDKPSNRAYYSPFSDTVVVPMMKQFPKIEEYYSTTFHELAHSTGKVSRLNREFGSHFGDEKYSREELVAEMSSALLCSRAGINTDSSDKNTTAYLQSWKQKFREDKKMIVWAASRAEKAVRYILGELLTPAENT